MPVVDQEALNDGPVHQTALSTLAKQLVSTAPDDLPSLSDDQQAAIDKLVKSIEATKRRSSALRSARTRLDISSALASPSADPRLAYHR